MKKYLIFAPILLVVGILLGLLKVTGMTAHVIISVVGVAVLVAYTVLTRKTWQIPALELGTRACYGIALITGIVLKIKYIAIASVFHKIFAILFLVALALLFVIKLVKKYKK